MCHRSVGLMQNLFEDDGLSTISITMKPEITLAVGAPRVGYVRFPLGNAFGKPFDVSLQREIVLDLLSILVQADGPLSVYEMPYRWRRGRIHVERP